MSVTPGTRPDAPGPTHRPIERQRHPRKAGAMFSRTRKGLGFIRATSGGVYPKTARRVRKGSSQLEPATLDLEQESEGVRGEEGSETAGLGPTRECLPKGTGYISQKTHFIARSMKTKDLF
jgi:hypothetical protein